MLDHFNLSWISIPRALFPGSVSGQFFPSWTFFHKSFLEPIPPLQQKSLFPLGTYHSNLCVRSVSKEPHSPHLRHNLVTEETMSSGVQVNPEFPKLPQNSRCQTWNKLFNLFEP